MEARAGLEEYDDALKVLEASCHRFPEFKKSPEYKTMKSQLKQLQGSVAKKR